MTATESQRSPGSAPGGQLCAARTAKGITLRSLARMLDLSPATLSQVENGRTGLSVNRLNQIAEALGLTATQILSPAVEPESPSGRLSRAVAATVPPAAGGGELAPVRATRFRSRPAGRPRRVRSGRVPRRNRARHRRQVRLSVSGIYHYYTSKQQMLARTLDLTTADLMHRAQAARADGHDPVERFSLLIENLGLFHTHRRELGFVGQARCAAWTPAIARRSPACAQPSSA